MKRIIKYMISCALPILFSGIAQAQITATDTVCKGENICLTTPAFRGTIQWQSSPDMTTWADIAGATNDTACFTINSNTYYRGVITENTCDPFYTDTTYMMVHNYERLANFNFTGGIQTFTVPADACDTLFIQCWGAQGGAGATGGAGTAGGAGGLGGYAEGYLLVNPGDVLNIFVGGQGTTPTGGFNGGGNGGNQNSGGGGGATDVRVGGTAEANRVITAGGGGGGGRSGCESGTAGSGGAGGSGGSTAAASDGGDSPTSGGVAGGGKGGNFGGIIGAAGPAGVGCSGFLGSPGGVASTGTGATGGSGQSCCCFSFGSIPGGGGGGGGFIGGGGGGGGSAGTTGCSGNDKGAGGGGGGGSSDVSGVLNGLTNSGIWLGNGMVIISY